MRRLLGTAFAFINHDLAVARYLSDRMIVMAGGCVIEVRPTETVIDCPCEEYTRLLLAASEGELEEVEALAGSSITTEPEVRW